jgi:hypothetical protein
VAFNTLLALLDDIATVLDDVAVMSKVAVKKTAGVLGDDLALNAEQVAGVKPNRELPVVWAVAKGSAVNKLILVPLALGISAIAPWAITPLLMLGGAFLCFEGVEKVAHRFLHSKEEEVQHHIEHVRANADPAIDLVAFEKQKVKGAIRTDFILSAEIVVITLGTVAEASFGQRVAVLCVIAAGMTVGVYGLVAGIVKLDDLGLRLAEKTSSAARAIGRGILRFAPFLMKGLSIAGTAAMFLVGGGIITHAVHPLHAVVEHATEAVAGIPAAGGVFATIVPLLIDAAVGMIVGAVVLLVVTGVKKLLPKKKGEGATS